MIIRANPWQKIEGGKMKIIKKKSVSWTLRILLGLLVIYVVFNQFDIHEFPAAFTMEDLPGVSFDTNNGCYLLFTLSEPQETDIMSEPVIKKYRKLFDPQYDNEKYIKEWDRDAYLRMFGKDLKYIRSTLTKAITSGVNWIDGFTNLEFDWNQTILAGKKNIMEVKSRWKGYLERYQKLIDSEYFEEFSVLRPKHVWPNMLAYLQVARVYIVINMLTALEGNWDESVRNLLAHMNLSKKIIKGSRLLITNLVAKAMARNTLNALVSLMNRQECPGEVYQAIVNGLPPIRYEEFGTRKAFMFEYLDSGLMKEWAAPDYKIYNFFKYLAYHLLFQENRTKKYIHDHFVNIIRYEQTPPHQWDFELEKLWKHDSLVEKSWFWWLQNPGGKIAVNDSDGFKNLYPIIVKSYQLKTLYDLTRISVELHLEYDPNKPVMETLMGLESYKIQDPCSGKPYTWDEQKQRLYGFGTDKDDDNGKMDYRYPLDSDFAIPVILYIKNI